MGQFKLDALKNKTFFTIIVRGIQTISSTQMKSTETNSITHLSISHNLKTTTKRLFLKNLRFKYQVCDIYWPFQIEIIYKSDSKQVTNTSRTSPVWNNLFILVAF